MATEQYRGHELRVWTSVQHRRGPQRGVVRYFVEIDGKALRSKQGHLRTWTVPERALYAARCHVNGGDNVERWRAAKAAGGTTREVMQRFNGGAL